jgi:hypothetical protein
MAWTPVIDISEHQGTVNFNTMRSKGIGQVIMRVTHGQKTDARVLVYYRDALAAGYAPQDIGFYSFINPKRGSGKDCARATASAIRTVTGGRTAVPYMLDVENYQNESPLIGQSPVSGPAFAAWIREHIATILLELPGVYVFMYSNRAYWNSAMGPQEAQLASEYEWLVPRYPLYSHAAYDSKGYPPFPSLWDEYAFRIATGPLAPIGAKWHGWQFSAGYNRQGPVYGCQSTDLDLNIVDSAVANKWFADRTVHIPVEPPPIPVPPIQPRSPDVLIPHNGTRLFRAMVVADTPTPVAVAPGTPSDATGVALNITFNGSLRPGFATLWSGVGELPNVSMINWMPSATPTNGFTVVPIVNGQFVVQAMEDVNLIFDQVGYTMPPVAGPKGDKGDPGTGATDEQIVQAVVDELTD